MITFEQAKEAIEKGDGSVEMFTLQSWSNGTKWGAEGLLVQDLTFKKGEWYAGCAGWSGLTKPLGELFLTLAEAWEEAARRNRESP